MYQTLLTLHPDDAGTLNNYANLLSKQPAQWARAAELYEQALTLRPDHADTLYNYATLLSNQPAQWARAAELYERALTLRPDHAVTLNNYATLLSNQPAQWARAAELYERALTLAPDNPVMLLGLVTVLVAGVDRPKGLAIAVKALQSENVPGDGFGALVLLFLLAAFAQQALADHALAHLKLGLSNPQARIPDWSFETPLIALRHDQHLDAAWLEKLAYVILGNAELATLNGWQRWDNR